MKWTQGTIERKVIWDSEGLFTLSIRAPEVEPFVAGQFLQLGIDQPDRHLNRPYSVASPHGEILDFFIVLVPEGQLTPLLWNMDVGDRLHVSQKAAGSFTLDHCPDGDHLWLIATGTGLAPYIAMLREEEPWQRFERITVIHGVRYIRDLAYQNELQNYERQFGERFQYVPIVSRETSTATLTGRITTCLRDGQLETRVGHAFTLDSRVFLCGNPDMLDEVEAWLGERGLQRHKKKEPGQIIVERYW